MTRLRTPGPGRRGRRGSTLLCLAAFLLLGGRIFPAPGRAQGPAESGDEGPRVTAVAGGQAVSGRAGGQAEQAPASHPEEGPEIAHVFLVLIAILLMGKLFGELAERAHQPAVLGELAAGVLLGGSVLGIIPPEGTPLSELIHVFAEIGVSILLFEIGLETDLKEMFRVGPAASAVAVVGVVLPFFFGFLYWYVVNPTIGAHPPGVSLTSISIFVGATLTATSVGITARVLSDLDKMHTREARIIIGAAVIDDVLGIVILAVVVGLVAGAAVSVLAVTETLLFAVGFLVVAVIAGNRAAPALFNLVNRMRVRGVLLVSAFCFALLLAALADLSGSAMIIGAFAAGIILSSTNQFDAVVERIEPVADVFTPIFFVTVGAPVNVKLFLPGSEDFSVPVLAVGGILTVVAILGKLAAGWAVRSGAVDRLAVGVGMIPRGEVGLIFAAIGLREGILSNEVYSAILIMVMITTFIVPPLLKPVLERGAHPSAEPAPIHLPGEDG